MQNNYSYKLTPLALQDIDETLAYITEKLLNGKESYGFVLGAFCWQQPFVLPFF